MLTLADLIESINGVRPDWANQVITEAVVDSRHVIPGCLFVALPGEKVDGHDFVADAFAHGAAFALIQHEVGTNYGQIDLRQGFSSDLQIVNSPPLCVRVENTLLAFQQVARFWRRKLDVRVIGITGSVGKSTTKELVAEVLSQRYRTLKNPGNLNNEIGLPMTMLRLSEGHERVVLEMGFYIPGEIAFLCDIALPHVGVITNIGTVHAERAGSQAEIARGKAELVEALPEAPQGVAILNIDDPLVKDMAKLTKAKVFFYGLDPQADLWAEAIEGSGLEGIKFILHYQNEMIHMRVPLIGRHSVHTALRAAAVGLVEGLTWDEIVHGLRTEHTQLRLVAVRTEQGALLLDDTYNASPESMLAALNLLEELDGRKVAVLGDMLELGIYEKHGHEMVGARAAEVAQELVTLGERGKIISETAKRAGLPDDANKHFENIDEVIDYLHNCLTDKDVVLVKGSHSMRMDRIVSALEYRE